MRKIWKNRSLKYILLFCISAILVVQTLLSLCILLLSGLPSTINKNSLQIFSNTISARSIFLEQEFSALVDVEDYYQEVTNQIQNMAHSKNLPVSNYLSLETNRYEILAQLVPTLIDALRDSETTSCFIILENETCNPLKDAVYLRDYDPDNNSKDNSDIFVEAGSSSLFLEQGLILDSFWSQRLDTKNWCTFYQPTFDAGNSYPNLHALSLGYLSTPVQIHANDTPCFTYSIPLVDEQHRSYGIIGFDISLDYVQKLLPSYEISIDHFSSYMIAKTTNQVDFEPIYVENNAYYSAIEQQPMLTLQPVNTNYSFYCITEPAFSDKLTLCVKPLQLYDSTSPFYNEQWVVCGIVRDAYLYSSSRSMSMIFIFFFASTIGISLLGTLITTIWFMKPIRTLVKGITMLSPGYNVLPKTGITEFDSLCKAIELQNIQLYQSAHKLADILEFSSIPIGILEYDEDARSIFCTHRLFDILELDDSSWNNNYIDRSLIHQRLSSRIHCFIKSHEDENNYLYRCPNFTNKWLKIQKISNPENTLYIFTDITKDIEEKEKILHDRDYDVLTNLYNRRAFAREMKRLINNRGCKNGVLSIWDLDNLKYANDTYGHDIGDKYICMLADVLKTDIGVDSVCARLAGDEFTLFLYDAPTPTLLGKLDTIHKSLMQQQLVLPDGKVLNVSASAGMACFDEDASTYQELLRYADFAMYQIKKTSKGSIKAYDKESYLRNHILVQGVGELDRIIAEEAIRYAYQPIVSLSDHHIFAYEALIRPVSDLLSKPDNLLRVAETQSKLGQIERITWFHALKGFITQIDPDDDALLFLNSIPNQIMPTKDIPKLELLYGSCLNRVVLEITESTRSENQIEQRKRDFCKKWNIPVALDDYGAGYSNSDMLVSKEFNFIKLDMSLIHNIHLSKSTQALVQGMITYCHENDVRVIAEGIESVEEYEVVKRLGADYGQGYYFGKPDYSLYPNQ